MHNDAPSLAKRIAEARPNPDPAPVISATLYSNFITSNRQIPHVLARTGSRRSAHWCLRAFFDSDDSQRFATKMLKLRVLLAQLPELAQLAQAQFRILLFPNVERRFPASVRGRCRPLWCRSPPGARPTRSALPNVRSSPPACLPCSRPQDQACRSKLNLSLARFLFLGHSFTSAVVLYHELLPLR